MRITVILLIGLFLTGNAIAQTNQPKAAETLRVEAGKGFSYPYYLYIPASLKNDSSAKPARRLLVIPNNTGKINDDLAVHEQNVKQKMAQVPFAFGKLDVPVLMPVFPRPESDWKIYTHALDRDTLLTEKAEFKRLDLQLLAMIDDARDKLAKDRLEIPKEVLMYGFSAAGMFVNRFAFLHPDRVKAVTVGSPGGWPLAPSEKFNKKELRYPIGTSDLKAVTGEKFDLKAVRKVAFFIFTGELDDNDSVVFRDSYEEEDQNLIFELFGKTPRARWDVSQKLYREAELSAEFKLYPNTAHKVTPEMIVDVTQFLAKHGK